MLFLPLMAKLHLNSADPAQTQPPTGPPPPTDCSHAAAARSIAPEQETHLRTCVVWSLFAQNDLDKLYMQRDVGP